MKVIRTADDYGAVDFIDSGIINALEKGNIDSVSCFTTFKDSYERIEKLLKYDVGIGLHLSFTSGKTTLGYPSSITKRKTLNLKTPNWFFTKVKRIKDNDLLKEMSRQVDEFKTFLQSHGKQIDHLACHHGLTHLDKNLFEEVCRLSNKFDIPLRSPNVWSASTKLKDDPDWNRLELAPVLKQGIKLKIANKDMFTKRGWTQKYLKAYQVETPDVLCDTIYGNTHHSNLIEFFIRQAASNQELKQVELMFHLGKGSFPSRKISGIDEGYFQTRKKELTVLNRTDWQKIGTDYNVNYGSFRNQAPQFKPLLAKL